MGGAERKQKAKKRKDIFRIEGVVRWIRKKV